MHYEAQPGHYEVHSHSVIPLVPFTVSYEPHSSTHSWHLDDSAAVVDARACAMTAAVRRGGMRAAPRYAGGSSAAAPTLWPLALMTVLLLPFDSTASLRGIVLPSAGTAEAAVRVADAMWSKGRSMYDKYHCLRRGSRFDGSAEVTTSLGKEAPLSSAAVNATLPVGCVVTLTGDAQCEAAGRASAGSPDESGGSTGQMQPRKKRRKKDSVASLWIRCSECQTDCDGWKGFAHHKSLQPLCKEAHAFGTVVDPAAEALQRITQTSTEAAYAADVIQCRRVVAECALYGVDYSSPHPRKRHIRISRQVVFQASHVSIARRRPFGAPPTGGWPGYVTVND